MMQMNPHPSRNNPGSYVPQFDHPLDYSQFGRYPDMLPPGNPAPSGGWIPGGGWGQTGYFGTGHQNGAGWFPGGWHGGAGTYPGSGQYGSGGWSPGGSQQMGGWYPGGYYGNMQPGTGFPIPQQAFPGMGGSPAAPWMMNPAGR